MRKDLTGQCLSELPGKTKDFLRANLCRVCMNKECENSQFSNSLWEGRIKTQTYRFFDNPNIGDVDDPRFEFVKQMDFQDLLERALTYEVADRNMTWEIPSKEQISAYVSNKLKAADPSGSAAFFNEDLIIKPPTQNPVIPSDSIEDDDFDTDDELVVSGVDDTVYVEDTPPNVTQVNDTTVLRTIHKNTPVPIGGIMLTREDSNTRRADSNPTAIPTQPTQTNAVNTNWGNTPTNLKPNKAVIILGGSTSNSSTSPNSTITINPKKNP